MRGILDVFEQVRLVQIMVPRVLEHIDERSWRVLGRSNHCGSRIRRFEFVNQKQLHTLQLNGRFLNYKALENLDVDRLDRRSFCVNRRGPQP